MFNPLNAVHARQKTLIQINLLCYFWVIMADDLFWFILAHYGLFWQILCYSTTVTVEGFWDHNIIISHMIP